MNYSPRLNAGTRSLVHYLKFGNVFGYFLKVDVDESASCKTLNLNLLKIVFRSAVTRAMSESRMGTLARLQQPCLEAKLGLGCKTRARVPYILKVAASLLAPKPESQVATPVKIKLKNVKQVAGWKLLQLQQQANWPPSARVPESSRDTLAAT